MVVDSKMRKEQAGFWQGHSDVEQLFMLQNKTEQCLKFQRPLMINFINFEKVFGSVQTHHRPCHNDSSACVKVCIYNPAAV